MSSAAVVIGTLRVSYLSEELPITLFICNVYTRTINTNLSYDVAVIQWITSCHKNHMNTRVITILARRRNIIDNVRFNNGFLIEIMLILKAIQSHFSRSYDKQNLTLVVISYEIYETRRGLVPGRVAQSVGHLTRKSEVLGSIQGLATYFRFSFR